MQGYNSSAHELHVTHHDVLYFCSEISLGQTEKVTFKVVNWLMNKHECYGRVWRDRGSWERAKQIPKGSNEDIREWVAQCYEIVERFTTSEQADLFFCAGGGSCETESPIPMRERKDYNSWLS